MLTERQELFLEIIEIIILAIIILALITTMIVMFCFAFRYDGRKDIASKSRNSKIFTYNYAKGTFMYFEKMNTTVQLRQTPEEFLAKFDPADKYQVENWLKNIVVGKESTNFLNANIRAEGKRNKLTPIVMELKSVNREKNIIHFETQRVSFASAQKNVGKSKRRKYIISDLEDARKFITEGNSTTSLGAVYYVSVYDSDPDQSYEEDLEAIYEKVSSILVSYMTKTRKMTVVDYDSFLVMDINCINRATAIAFVSTLETTIRQFINSSFPDTTIRFSIGVTTGNYYNGSFDVARKQSRQMSDAVKNGNYSSSILVYDPEFFDIVRQRQTDLAEIKYLIENKTYRIYYRPFISTETMQLDHYSAVLVPHGTRVTDFSEMVTLALANDLNVAELYHDIIVQVNKRVQLREFEGCRVSLRLPLPSIDIFIKENKKVKNNKVTWLFIFSEAYLLMYSDNQKKTAKKLQDLKDKGHSIEIQISAPNSTLPNMILSRADMIVVPANIFQYSFKDTNINHSLRLIQNEFSELNIPITYTGLKTVDEVELCQHYGGVVFQADQLGKASSRLEDLDHSAVQTLIKDLGN